MGERLAPAEADDLERRVTTPSDLERIAGGTTLLMAGFAVAAACTLVFQLVLARRLPTADVGRFFEAAAAVGIALTVVTGGLRVGLVRFVSVTEGPTSGSLGRAVVLADAAVAGVLALVGWLLARPFSTLVFGDPRVSSVLRITLAALPLGALGTLWAACARGRGAFRYHFLADQVSLPVVRLVVLLTAFAFGSGLRGAASAYVAGFAASAAVGLVGAYRLGFLHRSTVPFPRELLGTMLRFSAFRWGVDFLQVLLLWADTVILGVFYPPRVPGIYGIATRVVVFASVGLSALNLVIAPFLARTLKGERREEVGALYAMAARWATILTCVPLGMILPLRRSLLQVFGHQFVEGSAVLCILVAGYVFNAACGPAGVLLTMSTLNRLVLWDNVLAVSANLSLNLALVPRWGMVGAAVAWTVSLVAVNLLMMAQIHRRLGVRILGPAQLHTAAALSGVLLGSFLFSYVSVVLGFLISVAGGLVAVAVTRQPGEWAWLRRMLRVDGARSRSR